MKTDLIIRTVNPEGDCLLYILDARRNPIDGYYFNKDNFDKMNEVTLQMRRKHSPKTVNWYSYPKSQKGFFINRNYVNRHINTKNVKL